MCLRYETRIVFTPGRATPAPVPIRSGSTKKAMRSGDAELADVGDERIQQRSAMSAGLAGCDTSSLVGQEHDVDQQIVG
jgi:hypothetical protein